MLVDSRRKYVGKLLGIDETQQDYFQYWRGIHAALESYIKTGEVDWISVDAHTRDLKFSEEETQNYVFSIEWYISHTFPTAPDPTKILVEERLQMDLDDTYQLMGYVDAIYTDTHTIVDYKTTAKPWSTLHESWKFQAFVYAALYKQQHGKSVDKVVFSQIGKKFDPLVSDYKAYIEEHQPETELPKRPKKSDYQKAIVDNLWFRQWRYNAGKHVKDIEVTFTDEDIKRGNDRIKRFIKEDYKIRKQLKDQHNVNLFR